MKSKKAKYKKYQKKIKLYLKKFKLKNLKFLFIKIFESAKIFCSNIFLWCWTRKKKISYSALFIFIVILGFFYTVNTYYGLKLEPYIKNASDIESLPRKNVALILGAGINNDQPSEMLKDRLDTGMQLLAASKVSKLILSGDNRFVDYNEPEVMKKYLLDKGIPAYKLVTDYAGRSTYDSCYRAKEIFGQDQMYVVTQEFHIMRAVYTCRSMGIDAVGVTADFHEYAGLWMNIVRDYFAMGQAFFETKITKPVPVLGDKINIY